MFGENLPPHEAGLEPKLGAFAQNYSAMPEEEILTRAREAYIAANNPSRFTARRIRAGRADNRLSTILTALRDLQRPMAAIVSERDEATVALILRATPGLDALSQDVRRSVAEAIFTGVRLGRQG